MREQGQPPPWRWRYQQTRFAGRRRMPPTFVRRMGCAFAALIALAAIGASTLVSLLWRSPRQVVAISVGAVVLVTTLAMVFWLAVRRVGRAFAAQDRLRPHLMADPPHHLP